MNEVVVISKLQHRNLVRLLGFCIEGEERMLVYEFMPKNCLETYLFGSKLIIWFNSVIVLVGTRAESNASLVVRLVAV